MIALAAAAALVLTDARFTGTASARMETRARRATGADSATSQGASAASDAEVTPSLYGALDNLGGHIALSYSPTIRMREWYQSSSADGTGRRTEVNHSQVLEARWSREGRPSPYLIESFYFGRVDLAAQNPVGDPTAGGNTPGTGTGTGTGTPGAANFQLGQVNQTSIDVNGGVVWPLARVLSLDTSAGFNYSAGLDSPGFSGARNVIPTQQAYRTMAKLDYQLTAVDMLISQLDGRHANFPGELASFTTADVWQRWRRQVWASTSIEIGVLAGFIYSSFLPRDETGAQLGEENRFRGGTFAPGGDAAVRHRFGSAQHVLTVDAGVRVAPFVDRYIVAAFNRGEVFTSLAYTFRERWVFSGRASAAMSLMPVAVRGSTTPTNSSLPDVVTFGLDARAGYQAPRYWRVELYGLDSIFVIDGGTPVQNWIIGLALTLRAEGQT